MGCCCGTPEKSWEPTSNSSTMSAQSTNDDEELRQVFNEFDIDGNGSIQENELKQIMVKMGQNPSDDDVRAMFASADVNGDGKIDFDEFKSLSEAAPLVESLRSVFNELDVDGDGELTKEEMAVAFTKMGHTLSDEEISKVFEQVDVDKDGRINSDEFVSIMIKNVKKPA